MAEEHGVNALAMRVDETGQMLGRYVRTVTRADGAVVKRAGCRFIAPGAAIEALVRVYITAVAPRKAAQASTRMA